MDKKTRREALAPSISVVNWIAEVKSLSGLSY